MVKEKKNCDSIIKGGTVATPRKEHCCFLEVTIICIQLIYKRNRKIHACSIKNWVKSFTPAPFIPDIMNRLNKIANRSNFK